MRTIFLAGGFVGFAVVACVGAFAGGRTWEFIFRDAAIGCLIGAFLFRWLWGIYIGVLGHTIKVKRAERQAHEEAEAAERTRAAAHPLGGKN